MSKTVARQLAESLEAHDVDHEGTFCSGEWEMFQTVFEAPDNDP